VAKTEAEAKLQAASSKLQDSKGNIPTEVLKREASSIQLAQDEDVLDTWFSSWLWPFEVFKGYSDPGNADIKYYYPTNTLVTAPEIIFFWVARMIMAGFEYMKEKPFSDVYFTGIVRDELGRKMSKQLGNSPDLLALIDKYGADAVRFGIMISSPAGNDLLFDVKEESTLKQGSFFINKVWNALKLVKMWEGRQVSSSKPQARSFAVDWFENRLNQVKSEIEVSYREFRLSEILKTIYSLIWDDFCSWYLEWIKPGFEESIDTNLHHKTVGFFEQLMELLHPFMPFVTEEIYHQLKGRSEGDDLTIKRIKEYRIPNSEVLKQGELLKEVITAIRDARNKLKIPLKEKLSIRIISENSKKYVEIQSILVKQTNSELEFAQNKLGTVGTSSLQIGKDIFEIKVENIDIDKEEMGLRKELSYIVGFIDSIDKKLSNQKFIEKAKPEVVKLELKKKQDAEIKKANLLDRLEVIEMKRMIDKM
jgi:valyl-tRNA synthetase